MEMPMNTQPDCRNSIRGMRRGTAGAGLALAILLVLAILAAGPARAQILTTLHSFTGGTDGAHPGASLVRDSKGNLYGTTQGGGAYAAGTVFRMTGKMETVLYNFCAVVSNQICTDGQNPIAPLILDSLGNLWGTTTAGGLYNNGAVFELNTSGIETVLYNFQGKSQTTTDGGTPYAGVVLDSEGNVYGTTAFGGTANYGTVFKVNSAGMELFVHSFISSPGDGQSPYAGLVPGSNGAFYGTTEVGGANDNGTVFKVSSTGQVTVRFSFGGASGANPYGGLLRDSRGNLYGTTYYGGAYGVGTVFMLDPQNNETVLYSFGAFTGDGAFPYAGLVKDKNGNLYGTTYEGGADDQGTVFELSATGVETILCSFSSSQGTGTFPYGGVVLDQKGNLYGTTYKGGAHGFGTVFKVTP
jgi:uncharacterized repeat protein (TIGR03803 family)